MNLTQIYVEARMKEKPEYLPSLNFPFKVVD
jgi:hypothetical protein